MERATDLVTMPVDRLDRAAAAETLKEVANILELLHIAAKRRDCQWDLGEDILGFQTLLPHLGAMRNAAHLLALEARLAVVDKRWDDAQRSLQSLFALGENLSRGGYLVQTLVGLGVQGVGLGVVREWVTTPDSPNVYWALVNLPHQAAKTYSAVQFERKLVLNSLKLPVDERDVDDRTWATTVATIRKLSDGSQPNAILPADAALVATLLPRARAYLLNAGVTEEELKNTLPAALVMRYCLSEYNDLMDAGSAAMNLPGPAALAHFEKLLPQLQKATSNFPPNPLVLVIPSIVNTYRVTLTADRTVAALQLHEAIRAHIRKTGKLPNNHEEITDLPVPLDPATLKPYPFTVTDDSVRFDVTHIATGKTIYAYEIRIGK